MAILTIECCSKNGNTTVAIRQEVTSLQSNEDTANLVGYKFYVHFQGYEFWNMNISKTVIDNKKYWRMAFMEVDICHRWGHCDCWTAWPWSKFPRSIAGNSKTITIIFAKIVNLKLSLATEILYHIHDYLPIKINYLPNIEYCIWYFTDVY